MSSKTSPMVYKVTPTLQHKMPCVLRLPCIFDIYATGTQTFTVAMPKNPNMMLYPKECCHLIYHRVKIVVCYQN